MYEGSEGLPEISQTPHFLFGCTFNFTPLAFAGSPRPRASLQFDEKHHFTISSA
jgi:hypothetical protein